MPGSVSPSSHGHFGLSPGSLLAQQHHAQRAATNCKKEMRVPEVLGRRAAVVLRDFDSIALIKRTRILLGDVSPTAYPVEIVEE